MIQVLLVDDHPIVRQGVRAILNGTTDIIVIGEADNGNLACHLVKSLRPEVMLLDMELPGMNGIQVARWIHKEGLPVKILGFSAHDDEQYIRGVITAGIAGYLLKDEAPEMIVDAVRGVSRGEGGWISRRVLNQLSHRTRNGHYDSLGLTRREIEVLRIMVTGKTNHEIAQHLGISEKTVERHMQGVFSKLGVVSRVEAAVYLVKSGLV